MEGWPHSSWATVNNCSFVAKKNFCNFHLQPKGHVYAKFHLIFLLGIALESVTTVVYSCSVVAKNSTSRIFIYSLNVMFMSNFSSFFIGGWGRKCDSLTTVYSCSSVAKNQWIELHLHPRCDMWAKFKLSRLILIVISCHQLSTAVFSQ